MSRLDIVQVVDDAALLELHDEWNALAAERSVFLRHEWFEAAWQWRKLESATHLAILCVRRGERLVGVLPLLNRTERIAGVLRRALEFLTVPDNQLCDILVAEGEQVAVADILASELAAKRGDWDVLRLAYLPDQAIARR
jgi:hypothetical protein